MVFPIMNYSRIVDRDTSNSVIFSYWTKMLDLIATALTENHLTFRRIDGRSSLSQRKEALGVFGSDPQCIIMLASIGAAGEGCVFSLSFLASYPKNEQLSDTLNLGLISRRQTPSTLWSLSGTRWPKHKLSTAFIALDKNAMWKLCGTSQASRSNR